MPTWTQNLLVIILVGAAVAYLLFGLFKAFRGRGSSLGNCCAKGCNPTPPADRPKTERVVFMPVEMLVRRKK